MGNEYPVNIENIIKKIAEQNNISTNEVLKSLRDIIDAAWDNPNPETLAIQYQLFPNGKPSIEEFIIVTAKHANSANENDGFMILL